MHLRTLWRSTVAAVAVAVLVGPLALTANAATPGYSGRGTALKATVLGQTITQGDTGPLPSSGGALEASLPELNVPDTLQASVLHASTVGQGNQSRAEASVASFDATVAGNTVSADFLRSEARATCNGSNASVSGSSEIANLVVNGQSVAVSGAPNQTVNLPGGGSIVINEQSGSVSGNYGEMTVNALHIVVPGVADIVVASSHADIACPSNCQNAKDFVTGGGYITAPSGSKGTFGVAGGIKNGALWGHLTYIDHGAKMKVKGLSVMVYVVTGPNSRHIEGTAEVNGVPATYRVNVSDEAEPGRGRDTFALNLSNGYTAGGALQGGNIQLHRPTCK